MKTLRRFGPLALLLASALGTAAGCSGDDLGSDEGFNTASGPSIFFSKHDPQIRKILSVDELGDRKRERTGYMNIDGKNLSEDTVLIFDGDFYRYDAEPGAAPEEHKLLVSPRLIRGDDAANDGGFLRTDFKDGSAVTNLLDTDVLGTHTGVFRGRIIATDAIAPEDVVSPDSLDQYAGGSNTIREATVYVLPNATVTKLLPSSSSYGCFGDPIVDVTLDYTDLDVEVGLDGFPVGRPLTIELHYHTPWTTGSNHAEHLWDWIWGLGWSDSLEEKVITKTIPNYQGGPVTMPGYTTKTAGWGEEHYEMALEVRAYSDATEGPFAQPYVHGLTVVEEGARISVDGFELCPLGDELCHDFRDANVPENIVARRNVLEFKAENRGLYDIKTSPVGSCAGGNVTAAYYSDYCNVYSKSQDIAVDANVKAAAEFELSVNGKVSAGGELSGSYQGIASGEVEAELKGSFGLDVDFAASFETSTVWEQHSSLTTIYDPANTQIQWWHVVVPRLRYLEVAEFNACGARTASAEVYLRDLRDHRLVLACEEVPSYDTTCHAVEPTEESVAACETLLIDPKSDLGKECMTSCGGDCDE